MTDPVATNVWVKKTIGNDIYDAYLEDQSLILLKKGRAGDIISGALGTLITEGLAHARGKFDEATKSLIIPFSSVISIKKAGLLTTLVIVEYITDQEDKKRLELRFFLNKDRESFLNQLRSAPGLNVKIEQAQKHAKVT